LAWLLDMSREEKEQYVIRLYKDNRTFRQIAELMHMSFRDIGKIINKLKSEVEREKGHVEERNDYDIKSKSKTTQAIKLFSEGKDLVDIVIALDLLPDEVREMYRQFLELNNMHKLVEVYDEMENYLPSLLELFRIIESRGINKNDIINVLKIINTGQLAYLQKKVANLTDGVDWLENEIRKKEYNLSILDNRTRGLTYRGDEIYPLNYSTRGLTYRTDNTYPSLMEDNSIRRSASNMRLVRRNDNYKSVESLATEIFYASADRIGTS
jgi:DNA-binding Lrp family transcriptional regulator